MSKLKNPIVPGWYADPEARFYEGKYWIYVTRSHTEYEKQLNLDAFSSTDLKTWEKHESIINMEDFPWAFKAIWAPTIIEIEGKYFLIFASNDIQSDDERGGLEIAVSDNPAGPFRGYLGRPIIDSYINKAQPIDAHLFKDDDGKIFLYYGGWSHCNVALMNDRLTGFDTLPDGEVFKEITPQGYVEGPCMLKKDGIYYFMWSKGNWTNGSYSVCYGTSQSPLGPFYNKGVILKEQIPVATGPGHHSYLNIEGTDDWVIVYHRRILGDSEPGNRILCIDEMKIENGEIKTVVMS